MEVPEFESCLISHQLCDLHLSEGSLPVKLVGKVISPPRLLG